MTIKVEVTSEPTTRQITLVCPKCGTQIYRVVKIALKEGNDTCGICHAKLHWREE